MTESKIKKRKTFSKIKRRARRYFTKRTLLWLVIIALCSFILSALTVNISSFVDKVYKFMDTSYRPMDTDRIAYEKEKASKVKK